MWPLHCYKWAKAACKAVGKNVGHILSSPSHSSPSDGSNTCIVPKSCKEVKGRASATRHRLRHEINRGMRMKAKDQLTLVKLCNLRDVPQASVSLWRTVKWQTVILISLKTNISLRCLERVRKKTFIFHFHGLTGFYYYNISIIKTTQESVTWEKVNVKTNAVFLISITFTTLSVMKSSPFRYFPN